MEIRVAQSAGFCFGVSRSVRMAEKILSEKGRCISFGQLIHNDDVVHDFEKRGLCTVSSPEEITGEDTVIIRAHGISREMYERLCRTGACVEDATCPKVKAIHKIVSEASDAGSFVIIIGMKHHPEVEAICGWCKDCVVLESEAETAEWLENHSDFLTKSIAVVAQTTQTHSNFNNCINLIKKRCTNAKIFDTICLATFTRQNEATELARQCDAVIVIGGRHSANSLHLAQICREYCENVQFIERAEELDISKLRSCSIVGLTAGASTPSWIIKEVGNIMDELKVQEVAENVPAKNEEVSFDQMLEETLKTIYNGDKVTGIVTGISGTEVTVDLGTKYTGFIPTTDFTDAGVKVEEAVKLGDELEAMVVRVNDVEGTVALSKRRLDNVRFWDDVEGAAENGAVVEGVVTEENKGGVVVNVKGVRVFVPASQTDLPRDAELSQLLKKTVSLKITEVNKARKRVVGSIRRASAADRAAKRENVWNEIEVGKHYNGVVKSLTSYGAFVDIGGVDGMVHVSELSWGRVHNPAEVVAVGDNLDVYVISFDKEARRISLGHKDPEANPWKQFTDNYAEGDVATVKVVKLMQFGAFAEVLPGVDGLIHISQVADHRIAKVEEALHVGDEVEAKITAIDYDKQKISLSIRALLEPEAIPAEEEAEEATEEA